MARNPKPRNSTRKKDSAKQAHASPGALIPSSTTDLIKALSKPTGETKKADRRQLQAQHNAFVKKTEDGIKDSCRSARTALTKHRTAQLDRLSDLVKRKADIEFKILAQLRSLKGVYEDVSAEMKLVAMRLS